MFFFFFSSRRRHTRSDRDWSSDVCSSDLYRPTSEVSFDGSVARTRSGARRVSMASCASSASRSLNLPLPSTWCDDMGRRHRDGKPSSAITRRLSPPLICSSCRPSTSSFSMAWRSSISGDAVWCGPAPPPTQPPNGLLARSPRLSHGTRHLATSSAIEIVPTASSSERGSGRWASATDHRTSLALAELTHRTAHRLDPARMPGPCPDPGRGPSMPDPQSLCRLLQSHPYPSFAREGRPSWSFRAGDWVARSSPTPRWTPSRICSDGLNGRHSQQIVVRSPLEIRTVGHRDYEVVIGRGPDILGLADITDAPIPLGVGPADLLRSVRGSVVRDQEVEIAVALREGRFYGGREAIVAVVDWHFDRNFFHVGPRGFRGGMVRACLRVPDLMGHCAIAIGIFLALLIATRPPKSSVSDLKERIFASA